MQVSSKRHTETSLQNHYDSLFFQLKWSFGLFKVVSVRGNTSILSNWSHYQHCLQGADIARSNKLSKHMPLFVYGRQICVTDGTLFPRQLIRDRILFQSNNPLTRHSRCSSIGCSCLRYDISTFQWLVISCSEHLTLRHNN